MKALTGEATDQDLSSIDPPAAERAKGLQAPHVRALVVDDDDGIREVLARILQYRKYHVKQAASVAAARAALAEEPFDLVTLDVNMPGESGYALLDELAPRAPDTVVVMVTAGSDVDAAVAAMKTGAYDYLRKPFTVETVEMAIRRALERRELELENRTYRTHLEELVEERTGELRLAARRLAKTQTAIIRMACSMAESRDGQTGAHLDRMAAYCRVLVRHLPERVRAEHSLDARWTEDLAESAPLHDIGKVGIPDSILLKPGPLTPGEYEIMKRHAALGCEILETVRSRLDEESVRLLDVAIEVCGAHHERYNGTGYPSGMQGEEIPFSARVAALADFYDATTSPRVYRPAALGHGSVRDLVCQESGGAFDPAVVQAFLSGEDGILAARESLRDRVARPDPLSEEPLRSGQVAVVG